MYPYEAFAAEEAVEGRDGGEGEYEYGWQGDRCEHGEEGDVEDY